MEFFDQAACKGQTDIFFAPRAEREAARTIREMKAKAICSICPEFDACHDYIMSRKAVGEDEYGIWAGTTEAERGVR